LLAQLTPVSTTVTNLLYITASTGGQYNSTQPGLGYTTRYLLSSSLGTGFSHLFDANNLITTGQFHRQFTEVYYRVNAASASAQEYPYASPVSEQPGRICLVFNCILSCDALCSAFPGFNLFEFRSGLQR
jgi:hypothetical protein